MNLYNIPYEIRDALDRIEVDEETGEILNADEIHHVELLAQEKIENTALWLREQEADAHFMKLEIDRMKARLDSLTKRSDRVKEMLLEALRATGKVKTTRVTVSIRTTKAVAIAEGANLPEAFTTVKTTVTPNKVAIKKALTEGVEIEGCSLEERESVSIR